MTKDNFPIIAAALGFLLTLLVLRGSRLGDDGNTLIPLLTLLLVSEFGAILTLIGLYFGGRQFLATRTISIHTAATILCVCFFVHFLVRGFQLWPH